MIHDALSTWGKPSSVCLMLVYGLCNVYLLPTFMSLSQFMSGQSVMTRRATQTDKRHLMTQQFSYGLPFH